ncbi:MAG TPA: hypothetical protein VFY73_04540 [Ideonella sp.]|uniref:hypothetical protein n=1 Tax=Ideonella sp. TaxID=1929293 RepID=UPI002E31F8D7|nr:hypothetical protein [Ideonella sp.]HEX5683284.1 hypothetical protein [Ideonella sp.]
MAAQTTLAFDDLPQPRTTMALARTGRAARASQVPAAHADADDLFGPGETRDPAFELGWDFAHHGLVPPAEHLLPGHPLRHGWEAGRAAFGSRTLRAGRGVRQWLQLRLAAWHQGQAFEAVQVTPNFLAQIDSTRCPITRVALNDEAGHEAVVERVNHRAGYAAGNLATLSHRAQQAKGSKRWDEARLMAVLAEARQAEGAGGAEGLSSAEWARLATLMSFVTPLPHELAAALPLRVLPPNRLRLLNPIQGLQALITLQLTHSGFAVRIAQLTKLLPGVDLRRDFHLFFHTLLPRAWQGGRPGSDEEMRERLEDAWQNPDVLRRWQRFASQLSAEQADDLVQRLVAKGLASGVPGAQRARAAQWHPDHRATEGWAMDRAGQAGHRANPRMAAVA